MRFACGALSLMVLWVSVFLCFSVFGGSTESYRSSSCVKSARDAAQAEPKKVSTAQPPSEGQRLLRRDHEGKKKGQDKKEQTHDTKLGAFGQESQLQMIVVEC